MFLMTILASFAFGQDACDDPCAQQPAPVAERRSWEAVTASLATAESRIDELQTALTAAQRGSISDRDRLNEIEAIAKQALAEARQALAGVQGNADLIARMQAILDNHEARLTFLEGKVAELDVRLDIVEARVDDLTGQVTTTTAKVEVLEKSQNFLEVRGGGGLDIGPNVPGVAGPLNGTGDIAVVIGHESELARYFFGGSLGLYEPHGNSIGLQVGMLYRVTPGVAVGVDAGFTQMSFGIGQDGIDANKRIGHFNGATFGPMAEFGIHPDDSSMEFGLDVRLNGRVGGLWQVYDPTTTTTTAAVAPSAGLYLRWYPSRRRPTATN